MASKNPHKEAVEALHLIVLELNLTQRRTLKDKIAVLQKALGDETDISTFARSTISTNSTGAGRGSHWAERRLLQKFLMTTESGQKEITYEELMSLTKKNHKQLQVAFFKGEGQIQVIIRDPRSYGTTPAVIRKL